MNSSPVDGLERIMGEYNRASTVDFDTLREWESRLKDPIDLSRLYDKIFADGYFSQKGGIRSKHIPDRVMGYIEGQKMNALDRAEKLITSDELTDIANRRGYQKGLARILNRAEREKYETSGKSVALVFLDLDKFKEANDIYSYQLGDDILKYVAKILKKSIRKTDLPVRYGGDEFAFVLDGFEADKAQEFLDDLKDKIDKYIHKKIARNHPQVTVTASLGMSIYRKDASDIEGLESHAGQAMYLSKIISKSRSGTLPQELLAPLPELKKFVEDPRTTTTQLYSEKNEPLYKLAKQVKVPR